MRSACRSEARRCDRPRGRGQDGLVAKLARGSRHFGRVRDSRIEPDKNLTELARRDDSKSNANVLWDACSFVNVMESRSTNRLATCPSLSWPM